MEIVGKFSTLFRSRENGKIENDEARIEMQFKK